MMKIIENRICDVCQREVKDFAGSLKLKYSEHDYTGCGFPIEIKREDICIDCCRKLDNIIIAALKELEQ